MSTLTSILPAPSQHYHSAEDEHPLFRQSNKSKDSAPKEKLTSSRKIPPYGKRQGFTPRSLEDFGDGGAFPEIHVAQYPLDMGRKTNSVSSQAIVPLTTDSSGRLKYDAILGISKDVTHYSEYTDLVEKRFDEDDLRRPDDETVTETTDRTRAALEKIVSGKIAASQPKAVAIGEEKKGPTYIKYTPAQQGPEFNSGASHRIIRMVEAEKDPIEPPKFKHKKAPKGPPSPPKTVMHSPPRKLSVKDQQAWKIPPCIPNWDNTKGYTIPLDKRFANDGRGLQEPEVNDNFGRLAEALYSAERNAREAVAKRAAIRKKVQEKENEKNEEIRRRLAQEARLERAGAVPTMGTAVESGGSANNSPREQSASPPKSRGRRDERDEEEEDEDDERGRRERDRLREERRRDRDRDMRLEQSGKRSKRDEDRDISEKVALGQATARSEETMYDQRLFNQSEGMASGFGADDEYNLYSKPLFQGSSANLVYRPKKTQEYEEETIEGVLKTARFKPDRDFEGVDRSKSNGPRSGPVEFERDRTERSEREPSSRSDRSTKDKERERDRSDRSERDRERDRSERDRPKETEKEADPFGLGAFVSEVKQGKRILDNIGQRGHMNVASSGSKETYDDSRKRKGIEFEKGRR
eukprot:TRINITY_DN6474_c0_g1_i1.p1 TRINITY_DN6474_c0_g1~~TRINITY_DN6474_c0_g1_i1.p1  ORF type:complete len:637 (-),score=177.05 TRINITY_DN6474_c0_g1_i1:90-2000(-)